LTPGEGTFTAVEPAVELAPGRVLGGRYRFDELLGRGGMGVVWRAYDLKLRTEVALKAIRPERAGDAHWIALLHDEVRAARHVVSPNVCRVFDLTEADGLELLAMEYVDGVTLEERLRRESPLDLSRARDIAGQMLAGLGAIHAAGLIHRDLKPSNVMITRTGRVVIMDFGLAHATEWSTAPLAGTPLYMAPEQALGRRLDARTDLWAAGMILAEMIAPGGVRESDARKRLLRGLRQDPPHLPDTPWRPVLDRALRSEPERRFSSAGEMTRSLEAVSLHADGMGDLHPYPGLAPFTERDAAYFFGRETEIDQLWRQLDRPHLQAVIGPSGSGKSSFLRAGVVATASPGWRTVTATPGGRPFQNLARALAPEVDRERSAVDDLLRFDDPEVAVALVARWRSRCEQALVILDQFEELFTQNPPSVLESFADLVARFPVQADTHVVLAMRDDFFFRCAEYPALAPLFAGPFPLRALSGAALRRALVQPAIECGYAFEDEALVDAILAEVEGERGALPLMAFAVAQLWERRDRERGLLTRSAYQEIGGVGGALAQHAEAVLERIGPERIPIVRELFRNLVTAQNTRAARDRDELLSVFPDGERAAVAGVLDALVDARLLTAFDVESST
jgi:hypothetical protein